MHRVHAFFYFCVGLAIVAASIASTATSDAAESDLAAQLQQIEPAELARRVRAQGDARRGALVFFKSAAGCVKCHSSEKDAAPLGPDLASLGSDLTDEYLIAAILHPSLNLRKGYETRNVQLLDGRTVSGMIVRESDAEIVLRDASNLLQEIVLPRHAIEEVALSAQSMMPAGLAAALRSEQEFYDLTSYVIAVARGGREAAKKLQPSRFTLEIKDDSNGLDHAGILRGLNADDLEQGRKIYEGHCVNCHGADGNQPRLAAARAFGKDELKFGGDPYRMLRTLTFGGGLMAPMAHLTPKERYQVIHFIRERFMKPSNPTYQQIDDAYLDQLPKGYENGEVVTNVVRDHGPVLASQLGKEVNNALSFRLPGEVTVCYDLHRLRLGGVWQGGFLDLSQTHHFRLRGEGLPQIGGEPIPGLNHYAWALGGSFDIAPEDKPPRGPVRGDWLRYFGHYLHGDRAVLSYAIQGRKVLETIGHYQEDELLAIRHHLRIEPGTTELQLCVGKLGGLDDPARIVHRDPTQNADGARSDANDDHFDDRLVAGRKASAENNAALVGDGTHHVVAAIAGDAADCTWTIDDAHRLILTIPSGPRPRVLEIVRSYGSDDPHARRIAELTNAGASHRLDPLELTRGGPTRWKDELLVSGERGEPINGYALDSIPVPFENPWNAWMRTSAVDFFADGRAVVTTYGGDVYVVSGIDDQLQQVRWKRFATGLFEPFGVRVVDNLIYVTCRDGLKRLHDVDGNGEADFVEAFWNDDDVSSVFHAFLFDLQTDAQGNFYLAKAGQHTDYGVPGAILRIPAEGGRAEIFAWGLRTPNGMGKLPGDRFLVSDNQGDWMPAGKISLVTQGAFLGCMPDTDEQKAWYLAQHGPQLPTTFSQPIVWMPQDLDNSCGGQLWVDDPRWGPLSGRLLHSSYGKGWLFALSMQEIDEQTQAAIIQLPHQWAAGVMRLRLNPIDGQVYGVGLSGWQGPPGGADGCFQRLRYAGGRVRMIDRVRVTPTGIEVQCNFPVDRASAHSPEAWQARMWNYVWSSNYGSDHYSVKNPGQKGMDDLTPSNVVVSSDDRTVRIDYRDLVPCHQLAIAVQIRDASGEPFTEQIYQTIHQMPKHD